MAAESGSGEDGREGETAEVSPMYGFDGEWPRDGVNSSSCSWVGFADEYRDVLPGVGYMSGFVDARAAEVELLAVFADQLACVDEWIRTEKLIMRCGVGALRVELPASTWRAATALMRDGARYRALARQVAESDFERCDM